MSRRKENDVIAFIWLIAGIALVVFFALAIINPVQPTDLGL